MGSRRRTHGKSRQGCQTCKKRHVKCDELKPQCRKCTLLNKECIYLDEPNPDSDGPHQVEWSTQAEIPPLTTKPEEAAALVSRLPYHAPHTTSHWPAIDVRLYYAGTLLVTRMGSDNGHLLTVGTSELPMLHRMGFFVDHVRYAMLALRSGYYAKHQRSLRLDELHRFYKTTAISLLHAELARFSQHNSDSVLGASLLLWFGSEDQKEEEFFIQGTSTIIRAMQPWKTESLLPTYVLEDLTQEPCWPPRRPIDARNPDAVYEPRLFSEMLEGVRKLYNYVRIYGGEVEVMAKLFVNALRNLRLRGHRPEEIAKVRTTLRLYRHLGRETMARLGDGSPSLLVIVAYFALIQAYVMAHKGVAVSFSGAHVRSMERIALVLQKRYKSMRVDAARDRKNDDLADLTNCIELLELPLRVAAEYKTRGLYVFVD